MRFCRRIKKIKANSGETLVEVLLSMVIFMIMLAFLESTISFCSNMQEKNRQIRAENAKIIQELQTVEIEAGGNKTNYTFKASSADGDVTGTKVLFTIPVVLTEKKVTYTTEDGTSKEATFAVFVGEEGSGP